MFREDYSSPSPLPFLIPEVRFPNGRSLQTNRIAPEIQFPLEDEKTYFRILISFGNIWFNHID